MPVDRDAPEPLYKQLAAILRAEIEAGEMKGRLPSIRDMAADYSLAEVTVRKAMGILKEEGVIVTVSGLGTFASG